MTSMLDHLEWESLESWRAKNQLTMLFTIIIHGIVGIPAFDYLVPASTRTRSQHSLNFHQIPASSDYYKFSFFPRMAPVIFVCLFLFICLFVFFFFIDT